jgi:hypothetical protein
VLQALSESGRRLKHLRNQRLSVDRYIRTDLHDSSHQPFITYLGNTRNVICVANRGDCDDGRHADSSATIKSCPGAHCSNASWTHERPNQRVNRPDCEANCWPNGSPNSNSNSAVNADGTLHGGSDNSAKR